MTTDAIRNALALLDPSNDEHWTKGGHPAMAAVQALAGDETITRAMIATVAPELTRESALAPAPAPAPPAPDPADDPLEAVDHSALASSAPPDHVAEYAPAPPLAPLAPPAPPAPPADIEPEPANDGSEQRGRDEAEDDEDDLASLRRHRGDVASELERGRAFLAEIDQRIAALEAAQAEPELTQIERVRRLGASTQAGRRARAAALLASPQKRKSLDERIRESKRRHRTRRGGK